MFQDADKGYDDELGNLDTFVVYKAETNKQLKQTMFFLKWPVKRTVSQVTTVADLYIYIYLYICIYTQGFVKGCRPADSK